MRIGVANETFPGERRVALIPDSVAALAKQGHEVLIEAGAGAGAGFDDAAYRDKGATIFPARDELFRSAEAVVQVRGPGANPQAGPGDLALMGPELVLVAGLDPLSAPEAARALADTGVTAFALELMPRITRAQSMDILSSMATIAGYKAVLMAADHAPRMFPMLMTAAGTITPAHVLIIGAGVAGLQAIATARRLGAVVKGYDVRAAVKEQIESLGAKFVEMDIEAGEAEDKGGYARDMGEAFIRKQRELMTRVVAESHVVITTAAIPGKKSPVIVTAEMVKGMSPGSVIVDLAAERGGNCELTRPDETVVEHGVTIFGPTNLPSTVPFHASQMFARNVVTFLKEITQDGKLALDVENNEVHRDTLLTRDGEIVQSRVRELLGMAPAASEPAAATEEEAT
ncbi:MAG: Re/Si-specific NAD(P)(+) transhydrogenase subunit alpha [Phycisphaerae bacterium]